MSNTKYNHTILVSLDIKTTFIIRTMMLYFSYNLPLADVLDDWLDHQYPARPAGGHSMMIPTAWKEKRKIMINNSEYISWSLRTGYTLDKQAHHRPDTDRQSHTSTGKLQSPDHLNCMSWDCRRMPEYPEENIQTPHRKTPNPYEESLYAMFQCSRHPAGGAITMRQWWHWETPILLLQ